jgi:hypothetical protein
MGYVGVFAGVMILFPILSTVPVVQGYWLLALGYLLSGRWPSGVPAAWSTGQIERWPTTAELREQRDSEATGKPNRGDRGASAAKPARTAKSSRPVKAGVSASAPDPVDEGGARTRADTPKRKRKQRRR